jgi:soluble lytic murein transglycosylase-like protein
MVLMFFDDADFTGTPLEVFGDLINKHAAENNIDPWFLAGVVMVESGGDPNAYNETSGATGLGQVMPKEAGPLFVNRPTIKELRNPDLNLHWAAMILSDKFWETHSEYGAVYRYSGGKHWKKHGDDWVKVFRRLYWDRYIRERAKLRGEHP